MNCKPGDLAVMVRSAAGNEGAIVKCLRLASSQELDRIGWRKDLRPVWIVDARLKSATGGVLNMAADEFLRPIRDQDGEDETLTWAGKPEGVTA